jgi:hypothetical protein
MTRTRARLVRAVMAAATAAWMSGCGDSAGVTEVPGPDTPAIPTDSTDSQPIAADSTPVVSDPVTTSGFASASLASFAPQVGDADIVYVSLRPGVLPNGVRAVLRR